MGQCPICNRSTDRRRFGGRFFHCEDCDFHFADPQSLPAGSGAAYDTAYYQRTSGLLDRLQSALARREHRHILSVLRGRKRVVDIGCGAGAMVAAMEQNGIEAHGVDASAAAIALAGGKVSPSRLRCGTLETARFDAGFFDAAVAMHMLEHVAEPCAFVKEVRRILKDDGVLLLRIPNIASSEARLAGDRWLHFDFPYHVAHYSPRAARRLLETCGLRDVRINHTVGEYRQTLLYALLSALGVPLPFWLKVALLPLQLVFVPLSWMLALCGNSGTIEVVARK
ncbi:MAG: class I SAM-dependent methyltransferase [Verrucomicrobia bacterium]|nr:class I SAM-dependent methyltransferase [Verrucomicrobiota bacterium]